MAFWSSNYFLILVISLSALSTLSTLSQARTLKDVNPPMNLIDSCWRSDPNWASNRFALADCAKGFGSKALGGQNGTLYIVTDPSDDPAHPKPGTLRYGAVQDGAVWITFERDMVITLKHNLIMTSYKTIDGRGAKVEIANGPGIRVVEVEHVIIHGISLHDNVPSKRGMVRKERARPPVEMDGQDGDAIAVHKSSHVWIDHCELARATDGLVDITHASTHVTVSNNYLTQHDKVMLLGHSDKNTKDKSMKVTVVYNHFGPGLIQRMLRVRYGYAHVANNMYDGWGKYAIGGSANPIILSEGNYFVASNAKKQVTWRKYHGHKSHWKDWEWRSSKDVFVNDAFFVSSGKKNELPTPKYSLSQSFRVFDGSFAPKLTMDAGPLKCSVDRFC